MRISLFHNPEAGDEEHSPERLIAELRAAGYDVLYAPISKGNDPLPAADLGELAVIAGGDGSVRRMLLKLRGRGVPCAILPLGTANNIATSHGIVGDTHEVIASWKTARPRRLDVLRVSGPWGEEHAVEAAGAGLLGRAMSLIERLDDLSGWDFESKFDKLYRDVCAAAMLASEMSPLPMTVTIDGREHRGEFLAAVAMNINRTGPGLLIAPAADSGDGWLDVLLVRENDRDELEEVFTHSIRGRTPQGRLKTARARRVRIECKLAAVHIDDHLCKFDPAPERVVVEANVETGGIELLLPG